MNNLFNNIKDEIFHFDLFALGGFGEGDLPCDNVAVQFGYLD